jgi:hypothetical protein
LAVKMNMKVDSVSHDSPIMSGMHFQRTPFSSLEEAPIFVSLVPTEERAASMYGDDSGKERIMEPPRERVRIRTENQSEKEAEIIRPMVGGITSGMMVQRVPTVVLLSLAEFNDLGRPTIGDRISITVETEK